MDEKFFNQANAILNSKFARNIYVQYIKKGSSNTRTSLTIDPISIDSFIGDLQSSVAYNPFSNTIIFQTFEGNLSNKLVEDTLNLEFPSNKLNSYHITSINASKMAKKPIVLGYVNLVNSANFAIMEEKNQVVLTKTI